MSAQGHHTESGDPWLQGPKACMGPGTGLGQANLYWSENFGDYRVWPSEGAHASFAPRGWKQRALQTHVERQLGYCEVEHVSLAFWQPSPSDPVVCHPNRCEYKHERCIPGLLSDPLSPPLPKFLLHSNKAAKTER